MSKSKRLKILLYADADVYKMRVGAPHPYVEFFSQFGEVVLVHSNSNIDFFAEIGDVLALPGGADVDPTKYGEQPRGFTGRANPHYEALDDLLLPKFIESGKPIIGICRGAQAINVALGGSLHQHIHGHAQKQDRPTETAIMTTKFKDSKGNNLLFPINSFHHQSVRELGEGLEIIGWDTVYKNCPSLREKVRLLPNHFETRKGDIESYGEDNPSIVEAYRSTKDASHTIIAFQYHPEEFNCPFAVQQIDSLLDTYYPESVMDFTVAQATVEQ